MSASPVRIAIVGAAGRMGQRLQQEALADRDRFSLVHAITAPDDPQLGRALFEGAPALAPALAEALANTPVDVVIDFSAPAATVDTARAAADAGCALLTGTTGLSHEQLDDLARTARSIAFLQAANTSLGVNLLAELVEVAARTLGEAWDCEIVELHHRHKVDSPSGTALALGAAVARGREVELGDILRTARAGHTPRVAGELGAFGVRGGDVAGEHTVYFFGPQERLELVHRATDRGIFVRGALHAAAWLAGRPAGRYTMRDVLFAGAPPTP